MKRVKFEEEEGRSDGDGEEDEELFRTDLTEAIDKFG